MVYIFILSYSHIQHIHVMYKSVYVHIYNGKCIEYIKNSAGYNLLENSLSKHPAWFDLVWGNKNQEVTGI